MAKKKEEFVERKSKISPSVLNFIFLIIFTLVLDLTIFSMSLGVYGSSVVINEVNSMSRAELNEKYKDEKSYNEIIREQNKIIDEKKDELIYHSMESNEYKKLSEEIENLEVYKYLYAVNDVVYNKTMDEAKIKVALTDLGIVCMYGLFIGLTKKKAK